MANTEEIYGEESWNWKKTDTTDKPLDNNKKGNGKSAGSDAGTEEERQP